MLNLLSKSAGVKILLLGMSVFLVSVYLYAHRTDHPVIFYYGASPEVAGGTAIPVLNPFRSRNDEANAEWLIRDLRTSRCEQISVSFGVDPKRVCPVLRKNTSASLICLEAQKDDGTWRTSRKLFYSLGGSRSRLEVVFRSTDVGWGVAGFELVQ